MNEIIRFIMYEDDHSPGEVKLLFRELLIGVTQFFRDPGAFEALKEKVIPKILAQKGEGSPVRIWAEPVNNADLTRRGGIGPVPHLRPGQRNRLR